MTQTVLLLILFLLIKSFYVPLNHRKSRYYWITHFDRHIPLIPIFVIPYLSYFVFLFFTIVTVWKTVYIDPLLLSLTIAYVVAIAFWYMFPNGVKRPVLSKTTVFDRMLGHVYRSDGDTNGFPSAHVFVSMICAWYLNTSFSWGIAFLIVLSTLFTKQHYIVDIVGGVIVFVFSVGILNI